MILTTPRNGVFTWSSARCEPSPITSLISPETKPYAACFFIFESVLFATSIDSRFWGLQSRLQATSWGSRLVTSLSANLAYPRWHVLISRQDMNSSFAWKQKSSLCISRTLALGIALFAERKKWALNETRKWHYHREWVAADQLLKLRLPDVSFARNNPSFSRNRVCSMRLFLRSTKVNSSNKLARLNEKRK